MYNTVSPFDKLTWGDPMFAQIAGSDAQAYATDPASNVLQNMTTGVEQAPTSLSEYVAGANQPAAQAQKQSGECDCNGWWLTSPCFFTCINPWSKPAQSAAAQIPKQINGAVHSVTSVFDPKNLQGVAVMLVIGALAVGLILLGAKSIMEV